MRTRHAQQVFFWQRRVFRKLQDTYSARWRLTGLENRKKLQGDRADREYLARGAQRAGADPSAVRPCGRSFKTPGQRLWAGSFVSPKKKIEGSTIGAGVQSLAEGSSPWDRASVMQASFSKTTLGRPYRAGSAKRPKDEPQKSLTLFESLRRSGFVQSIGTGLSQAASRRVGPLLPCLTPDAEERQCLPFFLCASGQGQRGRVLHAPQLRAALVCKTS